MVKKSRKKTKIQSGKGYILQLKNFIITSAITISNDFNAPNFTVFTPNCDLFTDDNCFNFNDLTIENTLSDIQSEFQKNNYLYLRPYRGEKILIIACGNNRLDCSNALNRNMDSCDLLDNNMYHNHRDSYTLDMSLTANPSIVADFNADLFLEKIPDNSFNFIIFEGGAQPEDNPNEIQRLLNRYTTSFCIGMNDGSYYIYSSWNSGTYYTN